MRGRSSDCIVHVPPSPDGSRGSASKRVTGILLTIAFSAEVVVLSVGDQHAHGTSKIHQEAADVDVPQCRVAAVVAFDLAVLQDFVSKFHRVLAMFRFFSDLTFRSIREVTMQSQKVRVRAAVAMFHDVHVTNFVKLNSDIEMLKKHVPP